MAVKKAGTKKAIVKKRGTKKPVARGKTKAGEGYACEVCGLAVTVDETCGCVETCDIICCETPMKKRRAKR